MNHPYIYVGCFLCSDALQRVIEGFRVNPLENDIQYPHITFAFKPYSVDRTLFGEEIKVVITGYGNNGVNEGLRVELFSNNIVIQEMIDHIDQPHITVAVSNEGKPVNTKDLTFASVRPIILIGKYGGYTKWGTVHLRKDTHTS